MIRVFVADDHTIVREGIRNLLSTADDIAVVGEAAHGRAVLDAMEVSPMPCDVLVLDLSLPRVGGLEVLRRMRALHPALKVIILSMYSEEQYAERMYAEGAVGYLSKDRSQYELLEAIRQVMQRKVYRAPSDKLPALTVPEGSVASPHTLLGPREYQVFTMLANGSPVMDIAAELDITQSTVSTHVARVKTKLGVRTTAEIVAYAHRAGLVS